MSIRLRLILALLAVGILPASIIALQATSYMEELAVDSGQAAMEEIGRNAIREQALTTAQQIEAYLELHPEIDLSDTAALEANSDLNILAVQPVGETGYTAVFDAKGVTHFHADPQVVGMEMSTLAETLPEFWAIFSNSLDGSPSEGYYDWQEPDGSIRQKFMAVAPVGDTPLRVAATTYIDEFIQPAQALTAELKQVTNITRRRLTLAVTLVGLATLGLAIFIGDRLTAPIREISEAATRVIEGRLEIIAPPRRQDELGILGRALHSMTTRLRETIEQLERTVAERTADLEHRARYLEATAEVARDATSVLDLEELLLRVVQLISQHFDFYHTAIFLTDSTGEWAVLHAASSPGGQKMLARGHRLRVGGESIVGLVIDRGEARLAADEGVNAVSFDNPDLSETRSEVTLPLRVRGRIIGALDVQSTRPRAFDSEDATMLQALADQVAVAISNARLFQQAQESLEMERRIYGELSQEAWKNILRARSSLGFIRDGQGVSSADDAWDPQMEKALKTGEPASGDGGGTALAIPVKIRGHVIGIIDAQKPSDASNWTPEETALMETLAERLGEALESARLYQDAQDLATRERLIGDVTTRIRETLDMDTMLKAAVQQISQALGLPEVVIRLGKSPPSTRATGADGNGDDRGEGKEVLA